MLIKYPGISKWLPLKWIS